LIRAYTPRQPITITDDIERAYVERIRHLPAPASLSYADAVALLFGGLSNARIRAFLRSTSSDEQARTIAGRVLASRGL
jgi:hypothetical protein